MDSLKSIGSEAARQLDDALLTSIQEKMEAKVTKKIVTKLITALNDLMLVETEKEIVGGIKDLSIEDLSRPSTSRAADEDSLAKSGQPVPIETMATGDVEMSPETRKVSEISDTATKNPVKESPKTVTVEYRGAYSPCCPSDKPSTERFEEIVRESLESEHESEVFKGGPSEGEQKARVDLYDKICPAAKRRVVTVPSPPKPDQPRHANIVCDNCDQPIVGIRYKCVQCLDFDLCQECEALPRVHKDDHHFLKIKKPLEMPSNNFMAKLMLHHFTLNNPRIACGLPKCNYFYATPIPDISVANATASENPGDVSAPKQKDEVCSRTVTGTESKVTKDIFSPLAKPVKRPRDDLIRTSRRLEKMRLRCDSNQKKLSAQVCENSLMNRYEKRSSSDKYSSSGCYLGGVLVSDATVPENTRFPPGASFKKVWKVRNTGTMPWTSRTTLRLVEEINAGELLGKIKEVPVPPLSPHQEGRICVSMTAPNTNKIHTYQSNWRLHHKGIPFGQRLVCKIIVDPSMAASSSNHKTFNGAVSGMNVEMVSSDKTLADSRAKDTASQARLIEALKAHRSAIFGEYRRNFKSHTATPTSTPFNISPPKSPAPKSMLDKDSSSKDATSASNILIPVPVEPTNTTKFDMKKEYEYALGLLGISSADSSSDSSSSFESDGFVVLPLPECFDLSKPFTGCNTDWLLSDEESNSPVKVDSFTLIEETDENEETAPLMDSNSPSSSKYGSIPGQIDPSTFSCAEAETERNQTENPSKDSQKEQATSSLIDHSILAESISHPQSEKVPEPVNKEPSPEISRKPSGKYSLLDQSIEEGPLVEDVPEEENNKTYNPLNCAPAVPPTSSSNNEARNDTKPSPTKPCFISAEDIARNVASVASSYDIWSAVSAATQVVQNVILPTYRSLGRGRGQPSSSTYPPEPPRASTDTPQQDTQAFHKEAILKSQQAHLKAHQAFEKAQQDAELAYQQAQHQQQDRNFNSCAPQQNFQVKSDSAGIDSYRPSLPPRQAPQFAHCKAYSPMEPSHVRYPPVVIPLPYHPLNPIQSKDQQSGSQKMNGTGSAQPSFYPSSGSNASADQQSSRVHSSSSHLYRDSRYAESMSILNEMGFWNKALNVELLIKNNFDVIETINDLLNPLHSDSANRNQGDVTGKDEPEHRPLRRVNGYGYFDDFD